MAATISPNPLLHPWSLHKVYNMSGSQDQFVGLRDLHGRQMNSLNRDYMLPADSPEMQRLNIQHRMMRMAMGGLYPDNYAEAIRRRLEYEEGKTIEIADLGSGSGDWISDMAREFPHTYAVGVDLAPSAPTEVPSNVKFETRDVTKGLDGYNGKFDMVQARSIANGIDDYQVFVRSIADSLKPGGIVMLMEGYLELYDQDLKRRDSASGVSKLLSEVVARQPSPNKLGLNRAGDLLEERLREHGAFENIKVEYLYVPIGWNGSPEHCKEPTAASRLMMDNMTTFVGAWKPMLLSMEVPEADIDLWVFGAREELKTPEIMKAYTKWIVVCGTKSE